MDMPADPAPPPPPAVAEAGAWAFLYDAEGHDHEAEPISVKGPYTGAEFDLAFFSRNRTLNLDSSFSVHG